jgi:RNA polymerase sigma-70 factor, ECF subfamily
VAAENCAEARALFNDPAAIATLRSRLLRYAARDLSDADAEDATQEALLALLCGLERYRGAAQIDTYAHAMLRHKVVDVYRDHARELPYAPESLQAMMDQSAEASDSEQVNDPAEQVDARQQVQVFWGTLGICLRQLPQRARLMFELREVLELDLPIVCSHLAVTCNHGAVLAHRARAHVRRLWPPTEHRVRAA